VRARIPAGPRAPAQEAPDVRGSSTHGPGAPEPPWWLPPGLRGAGRASGGRGGIDLDAARALVAASWAIADAGMTIAGPARVDTSAG
jgi:hypothetical protein